MSLTPVEALRAKKTCSLKRVASLIAIGGAVLCQVYAGAFVAAFELMLLLLPCVIRPGKTVRIGTFCDPFVCHGRSGDLTRLGAMAVRRAIRGSVYQRGYLRRAGMT